MTHGWILHLSVEVVVHQYYCEHRKAHGLQEGQRGEDGLIKNEYWKNAGEGWVLHWYQTPAWPWGLLINLDSDICHLLTLRVVAVCQVVSLVQYKGLEFSLENWKLKKHWKKWTETDLQFLKCFTCRSQMLWSGGPQSSCAGPCHEQWLLLSEQSVWCWCVWAVHAACAVLLVVHTGVGCHWQHNTFHRRCVVQVVLSPVPLQALCCLVLRHTGNYSE